MGLIRLSFLLVLGGVLGGLVSHQASARGRGANGSSTFSVFDYEISQPHQNSPIKVAQARDRNSDAIVDRAFIVAENDVFYLDVFRVYESKLEERTLHQTYSSFDNAKRALDRQMSGRKKFGVDQSSDGVTKLIHSRMNRYAKTHDTGSVAIWTVENQWSLEFEKKYGDWINAEVDEHFLERYKIETDCADVAFVLRWVFARINHLPAAVSLSASGRLFTQDDGKSEWANLPTAQNWYEDQRFVKALAYVQNQGYTHTVKRDSVPVKISRDTFFSGVIYLTLSGQSGHTRIVQLKPEVGPTDYPIYLFASNVPKIVRKLYFELFFTAEQWSEDLPGLVQFRWPVKTSSGWKLLEAVDMPNYSTEQYLSAFMGGKASMSEALLSHLGIELNFTTLFNSFEPWFSESIKDREQIVRDGAVFCQSHECAEGTPGYEDWSTPSRDARIAQKFQDWDRIVQSMGQVSIGTNYYDLMMNRLREAKLTIEGRSVSLGDLRMLFLSKWPSFDPRDSVGIRWNLEPRFMAETIERKVRSLVGARELRVGQRAADCIDQLDTCKPGSKAWKNSNLYRIDFEWSRLGSMATNYCVGYLLGKCDELNQALGSRVFTAAGRTASLASWLDRSVWFLHDPRLSESELWGSGQDKVKSESIVGHYGAYVTISKLGFQFIVRTSGGFEVIDLEKKSHPLSGQNVVEQTVDTLSSRALVITRDSEVQNGIENNGVRLNFYSPLTKKWVAKELSSLISAELLGEKLHAEIAFVSESLVHLRFDEKTGMRRHWIFRTSQLHEGEFPELVFDQAFKVISTPATGVPSTGSPVGVPSGSPETVTIPSTGSGQLGWSHGKFAYVGAATWPFYNESGENSLAVFDGLSEKLSTWVLAGSEGYHLSAVDSDYFILSPSTAVNSLIIDRKSLEVSQADLGIVESYDKESRFLISRKDSKMLLFRLNERGVVLRRLEFEFQTLTLNFYELRGEVGVGFFSAMRMTSLGQYETELFYSDGVKVFEGGLGAGNYKDSVVVLNSAKILQVFRPDKTKTLIDLEKGSLSELRQGEYVSETGNSSAGSRFVFLGVSNSSESRFDLNDELGQMPEGSVYLLVDRNSIIGSAAGVLLFGLTAFDQYFYRPEIATYNPAYLSTVEKGIGVSTSRGPLWLDLE